MKKDEKIIGVSKEIKEIDKNWNNKCITWVITHHDGNRAKQY